MFDKKLKRREFLKWSAVASAGAILAACSEAQLEGAFTDEAGGRAWVEEYLRKGGK